MNRKTLDKLISSTGLVVAAVLLVLSGCLLWAHNFIHSEVSEQLSAQKIDFPTVGSISLNALPDADKSVVSQYAGQQLTTGIQAKAYADHYIAVHLDKIGDGKTYAQLSEAAMANPSDQALAGKVQTVFKGETLRGLLLNAYAFDTMATIARIAAAVTATGAVLLVLLAMLGFRHARNVKH